MGKLGPEWIGSGAQQINQVRHDICYQYQRTQLCAEPKVTIYMKKNRVRGGGCLMYNTHVYVLFLFLFFNFSQEELILMGKNREVWGVRNQSDCSENNVGFIPYLAHSVVRFLHTQFELIDLFAVQALDSSTDLGLKGGSNGWNWTELKERWKTFWDNRNVKKIRTQCTF